LKECYDFSKGVRKPQLAERLKSNGYKVEITSGEGADRKVVDEYFITPEEVTAYDQRRLSKRIQS